MSEELPFHDFWPNQRGRYQFQKEVIRKQAVWRCEYCGHRCYSDAGDGTATRATCDHRIPLARGGTNAEANMAVACWTCNHLKGQMTDQEFMTSPQLGRIIELGPKQALAEWRAKADHTGWAMSDDEVAEALSGLNGGNATTQELAQHLGARTPEAWRALCRLWRNGRVYQLTGPSRAETAWTLIRDP